MQISLQQTLEFLKEKKLLLDWSEVAIKAAITKAVKQHALTYTEVNGKLTGLVFGYWMNEITSFHVVAIAGSLKDFIRYLKEVMPQCQTIRGWRKGKLVEFKVNKNL